MLAKLQFRHAHFYEIQTSKETIGDSTNKKINIQLQK